MRTHRSGSILALLLVGLAATPAWAGAPSGAHRYAEEGTAALRAGQHDRAVRALAAAYALDPQPELLFALGEAHRGAGHAAEALLSYQRFLKEAPKAGTMHAAATAHIARLSAQLGEDEASAPYSFREYIERARGYFDKGQYDLAIEARSAAYALKPQPVVLFNIAQAHRRAGRPGEALMIFQRFVKEEPQSPFRRETEGYMRELRTLLVKPPIYKRWWFWGVIAGAAALAGGGLALGLSQRPRDPTTDLGTFETGAFGITF